MKTQKPATCLAALAALIGALNAAVIEKADNTEPLNSGDSWVGGVAPGADDIAYFPPNLPGLTINSTNAPIEWKGLATDADIGHFTFNGLNLALGRKGIFSIPNRNLTFNGVITLAAPQTWRIQSGTPTIPSGTLDMNGHTLILDGGASKQFKTTVVNGGLISAIEGSIKLSSGSSAPTTDVRLNTGRTISFDNPGGAASAARAKNLYLLNANIANDGRNNASIHDFLTEALVLEGGHSVLGLNGNDVAAHNTLFSASELQRMRGSTVLFKGELLGTLPLGATPANNGKTTQVAFTSPPALSGGDGVIATTIPIIPHVIGGTNKDDSGSGFTTYDATYGVRPLAPNEYASQITDGQQQLDNVRIENGGGAYYAQTFTQPTTINSLHLIATGTDAFKFDGDTTLTIASGVMLANNAAVSASAADSRITMNTTFLDLNGQEGIFFVRAPSAGGNGKSGAPFTIETCITNDAGKGVTYSIIEGNVRLGSSAHGYTGPTRMGGNGTLWLNSPVPNTVIPGDLIVNGGIVLNPGNQIPDSSDVIVYGGTYNQRADNNSGSGSSENFRDLFMYGGAYTGGGGGTHNGRTIIRSAALAGGTWNVSKSHRATITNDLALSGGIITLNESADLVGSNRHPGGILYVEGTTTISNTLILGASAYTPVKISRAAETVFITYISLYDDLFFYGNDKNDAPVVFADVGALAFPGEVRLNGMRTFQINDGAADDDFIVEVSLADFVSSSSVITPGGLIKTGAGTLVLAGANNTHTLGTEIREGTLAASGEFASAITVGNGAVFNPRGAIVNDTLTLEDGAVLRFDLAKEIPDFLAVNAAIINQGARVDVTFDETDTFDEEYLLAVATEINGNNFTCDLPPRWRIYTARNNTELKIGKTKGTILLIK